MYDEISGIKRPRSIEEDDPLWQYIEQLKNSRGGVPLPGEGQYRRELNQGYREQNLMNDIIPTIAKAGANMGTVGGVTARTVLGDKKYPDPREQALKYESKDDNQDMKRQMLYGNLMGQLSSKIAGKTKLEMEQEKAEAERQRRMQEIADKRQRDLEERDFKKSQAEADRAARAAENAANRDFRKGESEANRKLREKMLADANKAKASMQPKQPQANAADKNIALFAASMKEAQKQIDEMEAAGYNPSDIKSTAKRSTPADLLNLSGDDDRKYKAAEAQWKNAYVRKVTGAGMNKEEAEKEALAFFPGVNASPEVREHLREKRRKVTENFSTLAGPAVSGLKGGERSPPNPSKARAVLDKMLKSPDKLNSQDPIDIKARQYIIDNGLEAELRKAQGRK